jgi:hypothetical protein
VDLTAARVESSDWLAEARAAVTSAEEELEAARCADWDTSGRWKAGRSWRDHLDDPDQRTIDRLSFLDSVGPAVAF